MKSLVFDQGITPRDIPRGALGKDQVMITPCRVLISAIENAIYLGLLWVNPSTIIGSIGIGKVSGVGLAIDPSLNGRRVLVTPYSHHGGIGTELNGILAEEAIVPYDSIEILPNDLEDEAILLPFVSFARRVVEEIGGGNLLIIGGGLFSLALAMLVRDKVNKIGMMSEESVSPFKQFGVEEITNIEKKWDYVVISTFRAWARVISSSLLKDKGRIFIPKIMNSWPVLMSPAMEKVPVNDISVDDYNILRKKFNKKIIEQFITFSDDFYTSIPSSGLGTIVRTEIAFKNLRVPL